MPNEVSVPEDPVASLAALTTLALEEGRTLLLLVPDDHMLPALSSAMDLALRPLCLVLPGPDFAARIALRATLALLKSRLQRDGDDEQSPAWNAQRKRLAGHQALWRDAQAWGARNDRSEWPVSIGELFPVRILPVGAMAALRLPDSDYTVLYRCDGGLQSALFAGKVLQIGTRAEVPRNYALAVGDEELRLRCELDQLTQEVGELELELATAQGEMADFTRRYYDVVGRRMTELDALLARLASAEADRQPDDPAVAEEAARATRQAEASAHEHARFNREAKDSGATSFRPTRDVKRLFRHLAQKIHPDRARDEADRAWRTTLMTAANRAYRAGDETALREVMVRWEQGPQTLPENAAVTHGVPATAMDRLRTQVAAMRERLASIERELNRLFGSALYELFVAARQAWRQGRDLLAEMAERLDQRIATAAAQL